MRTLASHSLRTRRGERRPRSRPRRSRVKRTTVGSWPRPSWRATAMSGPRVSCPIQRLRRKSENSKTKSPQTKQGNKPMESNENLSKSQLKNKKRREAAKIKAKEEQGKENNSGVVARAFVESNSYVGAKGILSDPEIEKKIRKLKDKIASIDKIKQAQAEGKQLEKNQLEKLSKEQDLLDELKALTLC